MDHQQPTWTTVQIDTSAINLDRIDPQVRASMLVMAWEANFHHGGFPFLIAPHVRIAAEDEYVYVWARVPEHPQGWAWQIKPDLRAWALEPGNEGLARHEQEDCALGNEDEMLKDLALIVLSDFALDTPWRSP